MSYLVSESMLDLMTTIAKLESDKVELKKRIAELEKDLSVANELIDNYDFINCLNGEELAKRDLEQQAKGLTDYVSDAMDHYWILHLNENISYHNFLIGLNERASKLRKQAAKIKEQK